MSQREFVLFRIAHILRSSGNEDAEMLIRSLERNLYGQPSSSTYVHGCQWRDVPGLTSAPIAEMIVKILNDGQNFGAFIRAVKHYRAVMEAGLMEAKQAVERIARENRICFCSQVAGLAKTTPSSQHNGSCYLAVAE